MGFALLMLKTGVTSSISPQVHLGLVRVVLCN